MKHVCQILFSVDRSASFPIIQKKVKHLLYFLTYSPLGVTIKPKKSRESVPYFCLFFINPNKNKTDRLPVPSTAKKMTMLTDL